MLVFKRKGIVRVTVSNCHHDESLSDFRYRRYDCTRRRASWYQVGYQWSVGM